MLLHADATTDSGTPELRIGYLVAESFWGFGYATELVRGMVGWARGRSPLSLMAGVAADNVPSRRVLEKCGFSMDLEGDQNHTDLIYRLMA